MIPQSRLYKDALLNNIIPFWERHSLDRTNGGYFTCLDREGKVYDTDKFMWLQGRQAWMFSTLYNQVEPKENWLEIAKSGVDFIRHKGMDAQGNVYFSLTANGQPLVQPYNIFSDCFAAMAFAQYGIAAEDQEYKELAKKTYLNILQRKDNPKGKYEKGTLARPLKSFALPMILSNLVLELEDILEPNEVERTIDFAVRDVMEVFLDGKSGIIYEFTKPDGSLEDSFNGRLLNPGHGIEAMWFMIDIAVRRNDRELINKATETIVKILEYSWDEEYGGIFYFMDSRGHPPPTIGMGPKIMVGALETLVALAKAYEQTQNPEISAWYTKVHDYSWQHFSDPQHGEWFGYLNRRGEVLLNLKGGKWKGCFHVPRAMLQCWKAFERMENKGIIK